MIVCNHCSMVMVLSMVLSLLPTAALGVQGSHPFIDVQDADWFSSAVQYVYENNLMKGTHEDRFSPQMTTTRGMLVTVLHRMENNPEPGLQTFPDVAEEMYYAEPVAWANANGIVQGYTNGNFGPDDFITREQLVAVLYRFAQYRGYDVSAVGDLSGFGDAEEISPYAAVPMSWAVDTSLVEGVSDTTLDPAGNATRAQIATILMRFCGYVETQEQTQEDPTSEPEKAPEPEQETEPEIVSESETEIVPEPALTPDRNARLTWNVTFIMGYGEPEPLTVKVLDGQTVTAPKAPYRSGYSFIGWYDQEKGGSYVDLREGVTGDMTLYGRWTKDHRGQPGDDAKVRYTVYFHLLFDELVTNRELFEEQKVPEGGRVRLPVDPEPVIGYFDGWYTSLAYDTEFDWNTPIMEPVHLYAKWGADTTDSDNDSVFDIVENHYGMDPNLQDTDGDGLTDYVELMSGLNPLLIDSDDNGISDYDEDLDEDGLINGREAELGSSLTDVDSDWDGLGDYEEVETYGTDPTSEDTDGDRADDKWELDNGYDPLVYNDSFAVSIEADEPTIAETVTAGVDVTIRDSSPESVTITPVTEADNPLLSMTIAGYLGQAYDFDTDNEIEGATLRFRYDPSLGAVSEDFQPRIYYFNPETRRLEELDNQTVTEGEVSAEVSHFSTYILLNKVKFDEIWANEIKPPVSETEEGEEPALDIVFVIDSSGSMYTNDPNQLFKDLSKEFIAQLREGKDSAAVIDFIRIATLRSGLTMDKEVLNEAVDSIVYDNGYGTYSGTDGSTGIKLALDTLENSEAGYQYIVFITDGEDNGFTYSYDSLVADAIDRGVVIYTVGMGTAAESVLKDIAAQTGGKYYHATTSVSADSLINLEKVYDEIKDETLSNTIDSNNDGISDYHTRMIFEGKVTTSTGALMFIGQDFNYNAEGELSSDYDNDGLKNGEEIRVVEGEDGVVYLEMTSDPLKVHSDKDRIDDLKEVRQGSDPLIPQFDGKDFDRVTDTTFLYYPEIMKLFDENVFFVVSQFILGEITHPVKDRFLDPLLEDKIAAETLMYYLDDYCSGVNKSSQEAEAVVAVFDHVLYEIAKFGIDHADDIKKTGECIAKIKKVMSDMNGQRLVDINQVIAIIEESKIFGEMDSGLLKNIRVTLQKGNDPLLLNTELSYKEGFTLLSFGLDIADGLATVGRANAAIEAYEQNKDLLKEIEKGATNSHVKRAAKRALTAVEESAHKYYEELAILGATVGNILDVLSENSPIINGFKLGAFIIKVTGGKKTIDSCYAIRCYNDIINIVDKHNTVNPQDTEDQNKKYKLYTKKSRSGYPYYYPYSEDSTKVCQYLIHAAQLRMLAENAYTNISARKDDHALARENITRIAKWSSELGLILSSMLLEDLKVNTDLDGEAGS